MRRLSTAALALSLLFASCSDSFRSAEDNRQPLATENPRAQMPPGLPASEIRFALIGEPEDVNIWALFDEPGVNYSNHALMHDYWPRLYTLTPGERAFTQRAADGHPSPIVQEGELFTSTVRLRSYLTWTDGAALTASDVAFTANSVLAFELGFDWKAHYSPEYLERAEALDALTVKFYFKRRPNVGVWQYGVLQGPIVQKAYWEAKVAEATALLPEDTLRAAIQKKRARIAELELAISSMNTEVAALGLNEKPEIELSLKLKNSQENLAEAKKLLAEYLKDFNQQLGTAREALYALDDTAEPTLGVWLPAERKGNEWIQQLNPALPFERPVFDRALYFSFSSEKDAIKAFEQGKVNVVLFPYGRVPSVPLPPEAKPTLNGRAHFLTINPTSPLWNDPLLRQAIACVVWSPSASRVDNPSYAAPLNGFVLPGNEFWRNPSVEVPCADLLQAPAHLRLERAVQVLKSAGYMWMIEPKSDMKGTGLLVPGGFAFPQVTMLSLSLENDSLQANEAALVEDQLRWLGISLSVDYVDPQDIRYEVFSAKDYDLAILGWRLGLYPGYLCEWFGRHGQFDYGGAGIRSECDALEVESDLEAARQHVFSIQSILIQDLPFIPLYAPLTYDLFQHVAYPFTNLLGGLNGTYGAPSFAVPSP